ncbi:ATP-binding protein [Longispora sp. NPDC051575]|uniref:ATP-binding protein n=1 Tax=Longispora sp. NPDC051575 TaxID=3154943 RepID=UPI003449783E
MALDGGRIAAQGFQYQYLRTLEAMLDVVDDPQIAAVRVEGPPSAETYADSVDFDVVGVDGSCRAAVQVKTRQPGGIVSGVDAYAVLVKLIADQDASSYQFLTNGSPAPAAQQLADALAAGPGPAALREVLEMVLNRAPARLEHMRALGPAELDRLSRCRINFDPRGEDEIRDGLRERLRHYRNAARAGLGQQSAGLPTGYLVSETLRRAADEQAATFSMDQLRAHLLTDGRILAHAGGRRDWGITVGLDSPTPDVARPALLDKLVAALDQAGNHQMRHAALVGPSGIGKSSLAAAYIADRADAYDWILWVEANSEESLLASFQHIAVALDPNRAGAQYLASAGQIRAEVHTELSRLTGRWALVFDNVGDPRQVERWIPRAGRGDILITALDSAARYGRATVIPVDVMTDGEATELLALRFALTDVERRVHQADLLQLADSLSNWPLALELASGYMNSCGITLDNVDYYLDRLKERSLHDERSLSGPYPNTLGAALFLCLDQLNERAAPDTDEGWRYRLAAGAITNAAFLAPRMLPVHLIAAASVVAPRPETRGPIYLDPSDANLGEVVRELRRFSLVSFDQDLPATGGERVSDANRTITTNSIIQDLIRARVDTQKSSPMLDSLAAHVELWLHAAIELNLMERASTLLDHAETLAEHLEQLGIVGRAVPLLYGNLAIAHQARGDDARAVELLQVELEMLQADGDPNEYLIAQTRLSLAQISLTTRDQPSRDPATAVAHLNDLIAYLKTIVEAHPGSAAKLAIEAGNLLSHPRSSAADDVEFHPIASQLARIAALAGPTDYSRAIDAVLRASSLVRDGSFIEAEELCRPTLEGGVLTAGSEISARRILVESLVNQERWPAALQEYTTVRELFGSSTLYPDHIMEFVHNIGTSCALRVLTNSDSQADALLTDMLAWPALTALLVNPHPGTVSRLRLLTVIRDLAHGELATAEATMQHIRPESLTEGSEPETEAWRMCWQLTRAVVYRGVAARFLPV